jgi:hypothetical protein
MPALAATATALALAACGGSAASTSSTTAKAASTSSAGGSSAQRTALVKCLKSHGVTPPPGAGTGGTRTRPAGGPPTGASGRFGTGNPTRLAAFKACGGTGRPGGATTTPAG